MADTHGSVLHTRCEDGGAPSQLLSGTMALPVASTHTTVRVVVGNWSSPVEDDTFAHGALQGAHGLCTTQWEAVQACALQTVTAAVAPAPGQLEALTVAPAGIDTHDTVRKLLPPPQRAVHSVHGPTCNEVVTTGETLKKRGRVAAMPLASETTMPSEYALPMAATGGVPWRLHVAIGTVKGSTAAGTS